MVDRTFWRNILIVGLFLLQPALFGSITDVAGAINITFIPSTATTGTCGLTPCATQLTATVTGTNSYPITVTWDLGADGSAEGTCTISSGAKCRTAFRFIATGIFPVKVTATDHNGATAETTHDVTVTPSPPIAITPSLVGLSPPLKIGDTFSVKVFVGNSTNPMNDLDGWQITLGYDPNILAAMGPPCGAEGAPSCTAADYAAEPPFDTYGIYTSPVVDEALGQITLAATFVQIPDLGPSGYGNLTRINFVVLANGTSPISLFSVALRSVAVSTLQPVNPSAAYDGFFVNRLINPPIASFAVSPAPSQRRINTVITFDASNSRDPDGFIVSYAWNFDDGNTTTVAVPSVTHVFTEAKTYNVALTVTDNSTLTNTQTQAVAILGEVIQPPLAQFFVSATVAGPGEDITFDGRSSVDPDGCIVQFIWNFGDNSTLILPNPAGGCLNLQGSPPPQGAILTHAYSIPGFYSPSLVVVDDDGAASAAYIVSIHVIATHEVSIDQVYVAPVEVVSGQSIGFVVYLGNNGLNTEIVNVTVYYDSQVAATLNGIMLEPSGFSRSFFLPWDTTGVAPGNYTISARVFLGTDENVSNNIFVDGQVRILPPPSLALSPGSGVLGTKVVVQGSGFPLPRYGLSEFFITFDDMFLGFVFTSNRTFTFVFDVPHAEPGPHTVGAFDVISAETGTRASAVFQVLATPVPAGNLSVSVETGAVYFPGDKADIFVLATLNGMPTESQLILVLIRPNGSRVNLNATSPTAGLYKASYGIPMTASLGTYTVLATASLQDASAASLRSFEVKPSWLTAQGPRILSATAAIAGIGAVLAIAWRKGFLRRKDSEFL